MPSIEHGDFVSIDDLATAAREAADILDEPEEYDEDEVEDAQEAIKTLAAFVNDSSYGCDEDNPESVVDGLEDLGRDEDNLIAVDYFTSYAEDLCKDIGDLPSDLPWYIAAHIDWDGVASDIQLDYSKLTLDGEDYWHRDS